MNPFYTFDVHISAAAHPLVKAYVKDRVAPLGGKLREIAPTSKTYEAVASHADLYRCALAGRIFCGQPFGPAYPHNIGYNGVQLGSYFVHNLKYTAPELLAEVQRLGLTTINVKQGYTKCSLVVVDDGLCGPGFVPVRRPAVMTADAGIARALSAYPIDVLLIQGGHVQLPGLPYGFLGGASGCLSRELIFHGNLSLHPDFHKICGFAREKNKFPVWFSEFPLIDIGSIITLL